MKLKRFWFEFDIDFTFGYPLGVGQGCGITAYDIDDAIGIMKLQIFSNTDMPVIKRVVEDVDIRNLDQEHVIPNMKPTVSRGIWFPLGYD